LGPKKRLILRRELPLATQAFVIFLRFGSLTDDSHTYLRPTEVFKRTGVRLSTQYNIIQRWRRRGFVVVKVKRQGVSPKLSQAQVDWITSPDTLQQMAHLNLQRRCAMIRDRFQLATLCVPTLQACYRRCGVKYQRPHYRFWRSPVEMQETRAEQFEFVQTLGTMIKERAYSEIVYVDETTFHLWMKTSKCWLRQGMRLCLQQNRGPSVTVIGAISEARGLVHSEVFVGSNNSDRFLEFLQGLKARCGDRTVVVLDNLRIHYSKKLDAVYDDNFKEMLLPKYSCELNPIETYWSLLKRRWGRELPQYAELGGQQQGAAVERLTVERIRAMMGK